MTDKKPGAPDAATLARWRNDIQFQARVREQDFRFSTTWGIFSPEALDEGSCLLLDHIDVKPDAHCVDLGCGYGVLGMTLARLAPQGSALLVDKDFVAVDYARKNIEQNRIGNAEVLLSNGFAQIPKERRFDLAVSNLPAKVSKEQHYLWLFDTYARLNEGGAFYVVTINGLREFIARTFKEVFGNYDKVKQGKTYTISLAYRESAPKKLVGGDTEELEIATRKVLANLTEKEARVLKERIGTSPTTDSLKDIGRSFDLTRDRIREIEQKALKKLKNPQNPDETEPA